MHKQATKRGRITAHGGTNRVPHITATARPRPIRKIRFKLFQFDHAGVAFNLSVKRLVLVCPLAPFLRAPRNRGVVWVGIDDAWCLALKSEDVMGCLNASYSVSFLVPNLEVSNQQNDAMRVFFGDAE